MVKKLYTQKPIYFNAFLILISLVSIILSLTIGRYNMFPNGLVNAVKNIFDSKYGELTYNVFWKIRFPRTLVAFFVGGILGVSGCVLQGVFRNPLVSPDIIGIPSGASLGACIAIIFFNGSLALIQTFSFAGGLLAVLIIFRVSSSSKTKSIVSLILSGLLVNSLSNAGITILKYIADPTRQLPALEYWIMGSFERANIENSYLVIFVGTVGTIFLYCIRWQINVISLGDEEAKFKGFSVGAIRMFLILIVTFMVTTSVSVCGIIGWVGLISPHITRLLVGDDHVKSLPLSFFVGATIMVIADTLARSVTKMEIPVSAITAIIGAPVLGYLIWKVGAKTWN